MALFAYMDVLLVFDEIFDLNIGAMTYRTILVIQLQEFPPASRNHSSESYLLRTMSSDESNRPKTYQPCLGPGYNTEYMHRQ